MLHKANHFLLLIVLTAVTAACASGPLGGIINVPEASRIEFRGTVDRVDTSNQRIELRDRDGGGYRDVYYDSSSRVEYGGERYEPRSLERGDEVTVVARRDGERYWAETITVTYDAGQRDDRDDRDRTTSVLRGTVDRADFHDRRIDVELSSADGASSRRVEPVYWDEYTAITAGGRDYDGRDLREGDRVEVRARRDSAGYRAERIDVVERAADSRDLPGEVRGRVARVDTSARRIDLEPLPYDSLRESGERRPSAVYYDSGTVVEYAGRTYGPDALERGDEIAVDGHSEGSRFLADRIVVTYNARRDR